MLPLITIQIGDASCFTALRIKIDATNESLTDYACSEFFRSGQVGIGCGGFSIAAAARPAPATVTASRPPIVLHRVDGNWRRKRSRTKLPCTPGKHLGMPVHGVR